MRRSLLPSVGSKISSIEKPVSRYKPIVMEPNLDELQRRLVGRFITRVDRLGKRVVVNLDDGSHLLFQPKMAGLVLMDCPPNEAHIRLIIGLAGLTSQAPKKLRQTELSSLDRIIYWDQRGLGTVKLWTASQMGHYLASGQLGPDALAVDRETFFERFRASASPVKPTLLDQARVAGIGNLYASEILHCSGVHPENRCNRLSRAVWGKIFDATRSVLLQAIEQEGSTLSDGTYRKSKQSPGNYQNSHRVYDRHDQACLTCKGYTIIRIVQSQRSTFFCPNCQRKPRTRTNL